MEEHTLKTLGDIARDLGLPQHVINYTVTRLGIQETQRAGILRLYDQPTAERIERAVRQTSRGHTL